MGKDSTSDDKENEILGEIIRTLRQKNKFTIEECAHRAELSVALISKIERGLVNPSIQTLRRIAKALSVPTAFFFAREEQGPEKNTQINNKRIFSYPSSKVSYTAIMSKCSDKVRMFMIEAFPGAQGGEKAFQHQGFEQGIVIEGTLEIEIGEEKFTLNKFDTISFPSFLPHIWRNEGDEICRSIWAIYADYQPDTMSANDDPVGDSDAYMGGIARHIALRHQ